MPKTLPPSWPWTPKERHPVWTFGGEVPPTRVPTIEKALSITGFGWGVDQYPAGFMNGDGEFRAVEDRWVIVHGKTGDPLGIVSDHHEIKDNAGLLSYVDFLLGRQGFNIEMVGSTNAMANVHVMVSTDVVHEDSALGDTYRLFLMCTASHRKRPNPSLVVYRDLSSTVQNVQTSQISLDNDDEKIAENLILDGREYIKTFVDDLDWLREQPMTDQEARAVVHDVIPSYRRNLTVIEWIIEQARTSDSIRADERGTRFALFQSLCEWIDWTRTVQNEGARFRVSCLDYGVQYRRSMLNILLT